MRWLAFAALLGGCAFPHGALGETGDAGDDVDASDDVDAAIDAMIDAPLDAPSPACTDGILSGSNCRRAYSCDELHQAHPSLGDAAYSIDPDGAGGAAQVTTYCDMTTDGGGWTLVGKVDGRFDMYNTWLVSNVNAAALTTPTIGTNTYASINAVVLAVDRSTEIRLSNSTRTRWVKWPLPASRAVGTFWHHTVGYTTINGAPQPTVTVTGWDASTATCNQNEYGVLPWDTHGGAFPAVGRNAAGNTLANDLCMAVGTQTTTTAIDGFTSNGNQFDAPVDETTWPNTAYNVTPHVAVWLR